MEQRKTPPGGDVEGVEIVDVFDPRVGFTPVQQRWLEGLIEAVAARAVREHLADRRRRF